MNVELSVDVYEFRLTPSGRRYVWRIDCVQCAELHELAQDDYEDPEVEEVTTMPDEPEHGEASGLDWAVAWATKHVTTWHAMPEHLEEPA